MFKRLLSLLLTLLMLCSLFGCMPSGTTLYSIYLMPNGSGPEIFLDTAPTYDKIPAADNTKMEKPVQTREILFQEQLVQISYDSVVENDLCQYIDQDHSLTCQFSLYSGKLLKIAAENWLDPTLAAEMTEDNYLQWIYDQVSVYYTEDWSQYVLTCATEVQNTISGKSSTQRESGFYLPFDNFELVDSYTFTFTKYLGDYPTTDMIQVVIHPNIGSVSIQFSPHDFDQMEDIKIDTDLIQASVFQFLSDSVGQTKYAYTKHSSTKPRLTYIKGHLTYLCTVQIDVTSLNDMEKFESEVVLQPVAILLQ